MCDVCAITESCGDSCTNLGDYVKNALKYLDGRRFLSDTLKNGYEIIFPTGNISNPIE